MEIEKVGGIMMFIIRRITLKTNEAKWVKNRWIDRKILEDIFDELMLRGVEVYTHFDFDNPWETLDRDMALFVEIGWLDVESRFDLVNTKEGNGGMVLQEKIYVHLTEKGINLIGDSGLAIARHQEMIEEILNNIVIKKN